MKEVEWFIRIVGFKKAHTQILTGKLTYVWHRQQAACWEEDLSTLDCEHQTCSASRLVRTAAPAPLPASN